MKALSRLVTRSDTHKGTPVSDTTRTLTAVNLANTLRGGNRKKTRDKTPSITKDVSTPLTRSDVKPIEAPETTIATKTKVDEQSPNKDVLIQNQRFREEDVRWRNEDKRIDQEKDRSNVVNKQQTNMVQQQILHEIQAIRYILKDGKLSQVSPQSIQDTKKGGGIMGTIGSLISGGLSIGVSSLLLKGGIGGIVQRGIGMITKPFNSLFNGISNTIGKTRGLLSGVTNTLSNLKDKPKNIIKSIGKNVVDKGKNVLGSVSKPSVTKSATKGIAKSAGKSGLKKIPILGALAGLGFGAHRMFKGDFKGAGLEVMSGLTSTIPVAGTATSLGIDGYLMKHDSDLRNKGVSLEAENIIRENNNGQFYKTSETYDRIIENRIREENNLKPITTLNPTDIQNYIENKEYYDNLSTEDNTILNRNSDTNITSNNDKQIEFIKGSYVTDGLSTINEYNQDNSHIVINNVVPPQQTAPRASTLIEGGGTEGSQAPMIIAPTDSAIRAINMQLLAKGMV